MKYLLSILICTFYLFVQSQNNNVAINNNGALPDPSALLDINHPTKGILISRTDTTSIISPVKGLMIFDTIRNAFAFYTGIRWAFINDNVHSSFYYYDGDEDGYGIPSNLVYAPFAPSGFIGQSGDCDDNDLNINPNATEICDGKDNDCDGMMDEENVCNFVISSVTHASGNTNLTSHHTISVTGLNASVTPAKLELLEGGTTYNIPFSWDVGNNEVIEFTLPNGLLAGLYDVKITASNMQFALVVDGFQLSDVISIIVQSVNPPSVYNGIENVIRIECDAMAGPSFIDPLAAYIKSVSTGDVYGLSSIEFIDPTNINATVPSGLPNGSYDVWVINPDGVAGLLTSALSISPDFILYDGGSNSQSSVLLVFNHEIDGTTLLSGGGNFSFDNGLSATGASLFQPNIVEVKTSIQSNGVLYTVTASGIKDIFGSSLSASGNTLSFQANF